MATALEHDELASRIAGRFADLSPQLRKAARHLLDHPDDVALRSMRELAVAANLPAVTFVRLARALDFADYDSLRRVFQDRLRAGPARAPYSPKARDLQLRGDAGTVELLKDLFNSELDNIEATFQRNHPDALTRAVERIEGARRVAVLGQRSCFPTAYFFNYVYRLFRGNAVLLQNQGAGVADDLRDLGPDDLLIAVSVAPYTAEVVQAVRYAAEHGIPVLAITDDVLSPIARAAGDTLLVTAATPSFFHSIVAMVALTQALLALLVARGGAQAVAAIEASEAHLAQFNAYWPGETS